MYVDGQGVPQNPAEGANWCRKAAERGYLAAQRDLGWMYASGEGIPQDHAEAAKWFRTAAEQGDPKAQKNLGGRRGGIPRRGKETARAVPLAVPADRFARTSLRLLPILLRGYRPHDFAVRLWDGTIWGPGEGQPARF